MKVINNIPTANTDKETVVKDGKTYYICSVCGRLSFRKTKSYGKIYCTKHYRQVKKHGHALDTNPRTPYDRNEIRIYKSIAEMDIYNKNNHVIATTIFDPEDVPRVRYIKWKLSASGYVMNTPKFKGSSQHLSHLIMCTDQFIDHRNHNTLDNRKENLRIVTKSQNQMNSNNKGVNTRPDGRFYAYIKKNQRMLNLGVYVDKEEAMFARWYAEQKLFGEYAYPKPKPKILTDRESQIKKYVEKKVQRL